MSRLIDADALMEELHHMIDGDSNLRKDYEYMGMDDCIRSMPTAFDTEKVVAELEESSRPEIADDMDAFGDIPSIVVSLNTAIDIVKRGGAS